MFSFHSLFSARNVARTAVWGERARYQAAEWATLLVTVEFLQLNCQSPDNVNKFTVVELKEYLRQRDLNLSGNKNELREKVFYAYKLAVP